MNLPGIYPEKFINSSSQSSSALTTLTHCLCGWFVAFASKTKTSNKKKAKKPRQYYKTRYFVFNLKLPCIGKGQLISKGLFNAIVSTKKPTKFFYLNSFLEAVAEIL